MNPHPGFDDLLRSVLAEVLPPDREAASLSATLREVSRQHRQRVLRHHLMIVAGLAIVVALTALRRPSPPASMAGARAPDGARAPSEFDPVPAVTSRPLLPACIVETTRGATPIVHSAAMSLVEVETADSSPRATLLTDDVLLGLLDGKPAALVRSDGATRLVLAGAP